MNGCQDSNRIFKFCTTQENFSSRSLQANQFPFQAKECTEIYLFSCNFHILFHSFEIHCLKEKDESGTFGNQEKTSASTYRVATNTRPRRVFFCLLKPQFSWTSINCFHGFLTRSEKVPSLLNEKESVCIRKEFNSERIGLCCNLFIPVHARITRVQSRVTR